MNTVQDILNLSTGYLVQKGIKNPKLQAEYLLCDALQLSRIQLYQQFDRPLEEQELKICRERLARRAKGEPLGYIHGKMDFYGCQISVNKDVLIPRQETEILVDKIVKQLEQVEVCGLHLWDVCCGSGCIGVSLKKKFPLLEVTLSDISPQALELAKKNAKENQVEVHFLQGDLLKPFEGKKVDYLVCNPPYIAEYEFAGLDHEVRDFEPRLALISGPTGLEMYQRLSEQMKACLAPLAKVWLEMGSSQGPSLCKLFSQSGWRNYRVDKDWAGLDRFFFLENE